VFACGGGEQTSAGKIRTSTWKSASDDPTPIGRESLRQLILDGVLRKLQNFHQVSRKTVKKFLEK
jgi:hypothetical protein